MLFVNTMERVHYNIQVKGKVQGVWFRKYTKEKADNLGLKGFVKNEVNEDVYIEVEGTKIMLTHFINWLYEGSPFSNVSEVIYKSKGVQNFIEFEIIR